MALSDDAPGGEKTGQPVSDPLSGANPGEPDVCFEGLPLLSLLAAAVFSFVVLWKTPSLAYPILAAMAGPGSNGGPLLLPFFMGGWLETLLGPVVLTVASLILHVAQGHYRFPDWLPFAFSVPVAVGLLAPRCWNTVDRRWIGWLSACLRPPSSACTGKCSPTRGSCGIDGPLRSLWPDGRGIG